MADIHTIIQTGTNIEVIAELVKPGVLEEVIGPRTNYPPPLVDGIEFS